MLDARKYLRPFPSGVRATHAAPTLAWRSEWDSVDGAGTTIGLIDAGLAPEVADLAAADLEPRWFGGEHPRARTSLDEHGAHSASLLVGQGRSRIRGVVPGAHLLMACVAEPNGMAQPSAVVRALDWLEHRGARVIALPLACDEQDDDLAAAVAVTASRGLLIVAAAGNAGGAVQFPARARGCVAVGAATPSGRLLEECGRGPALDLIAPGRAITGGVYGRVVRRRRGTSVACVLAAGAAAAAAASGAVPRHPTHEDWLAALTAGKRSPPARRAARPARPARDADPRRTSGTASLT